MKSNLPFSTPSFSSRPSRSPLSPALRRMDSPVLTADRPPRVFGEIGQLWTPGLLDRLQPSITRYRD